MGPRPSPVHSLDRIDNNKGYGPKNCRWATKREQANNTRHNRLVTLGGHTHTVSNWAAKLGLSASTVWNRLDRGWPLERALSAKGTVKCINCGTIMVQKSKDMWAELDKPMRNGRKL